MLTRPGPGASDWSRPALLLVLALGVAGCLGEASQTFPGADAVADTGADSGVATDAAADLDSGVDPGSPDLVDADADVDGAPDAAVQPDAPSDVGGDDGAADTARDMVSDLPRDADAGDDGGAPVEGPAVYPLDRTHSPITPYVADRLRSIAAAGSEGRDNVFMKVGDSITVSAQFLNCLAAPGVDFPGRPDLAATHAFFRAAEIGTETSFDRDSWAAEGGRTAAWCIAGDPSPLERETAEIEPRFAVVMYGTNDIGYWPEDRGRMFRWYGDAFMRLIDQLIEGGVVPIVMSIPPRDDDAFLDGWVATMNLVIRGFAQARQIPFADFHRELVPLPDHGLSGDGVHPNVYWPDGPDACDFTSAGLSYGYNVRNYLTVEALDRVRRVVVEEALAPDPPTGEVLPGAGTSAAPFLIEALPFTHLADTGEAPQDRFDTYPDCSTGQDESGGEVVYRLDLAHTTRLRAMVLDVGGVDVDLHVLGAGGEPEDCRGRDDTLLQGTLGPGTYYLVADTFVSGGTPYPGEYLLVVLECEPGDASCDALL